MEKQKEFELLVSSLALAIHRFYLKQVINEELTEAQYLRNRFFWDTISLSLEQSYLIGLAKFFEKPKEINETISIYYFYDFGKNSLIDKIKKFRNKLIAHHDKNLIHTSFIEKLKITEEEIKSLFDTGTQLVENLKNEFGYIWEDHTTTGFLVDKEILRKQFNEIVNSIKWAAQDTSMCYNENIKNNLTG